MDALKSIWTCFTVHQHQSLLAQNSFLPIKCCLCVCVCVCKGGGGAVFQKGWAYHKLQVTFTAKVYQGFDYLHVVLVSI